MKTFKVYFEIFGKKMVYTIVANNENDAKERLLKKVIFHKVDEVKPYKSQSIEELFKDILEIIK